MTSKPVDLPADLASAYLALLSEREMLQAERDVVVAERDTVVAEWDMAVAQAANAQAMLSDSEALIASLELAIEKLKRELRGRRSERTALLIDQMELQLEELVMAPKSQRKRPPPRPRAFDLDAGRPGRYGTAALLPIFDLIEAHVFAAERLFGDDTTIPIQAKDKCTTGRIWTYVCDYVHLVIMRRLLRQEVLTVGFSDDFRLANCA